MTATAAEDPPPGHAAAVARRLAAALRSMATADPRTLGLFRIAVALLLLADLVKRAWSRDLWYSETGLFTVAGQVDEARRIGFWSVLWYVTSDAAVTALFVAAGVIYIGLLVGYRTKVFQALALFSVVSLQARVSWLCNGGDFVLCSLLWWTLFLPLGRRFSVDARRATGASPTGPVVSAAMVVCLVQLALIYLLNALHKSGETWQKGTAVHYVLQQERVMTWLGLWAREHLPFGLTRALSHGVWWLELALPLLILSPFWKTECRRLAIAGILTLHVGLALFANFGVFSAVMCVFAMLLWTAPDWDALEAWVRPRFPALAARLAPAAAQASPQASGSAARLARALGAAAIVLPLALAVPQVLVENDAVPAPLRIRRPPAWFNRLVWTTRLRQGWHMFAPNAPTREASVVVDAETADGQHIDPLYAIALGKPTPSLDQVPVGAGLDVYWVDYLHHMPRSATLRRDLRRWLDAYPQRTGLPGGRLEQYTVWAITQDSPPPRRAGPTNVQKKVVLQRASTAAAGPDA
jgi:hypothetical protein